jgi:NAD-dependent DNA ligase
MDDPERAVQRAQYTHRLNKAVEHMIGLVTGIIADRHLHDLEIALLRTWLSENSIVTTTWPGFVVARKVEEIMEDGKITEEERSHLLDVLSQLAATDFAVTGSSSPEVAALPINDVVTIILKNATVCHTGEFLFGTRAACERITLQAGGVAVDAVTRRTDLLVVGTRVSPNWAHTSFGRKIQKAAELQADGHPIEIISERRWIEAMNPSSVQ